MSAREQSLMQQARDQLERAERIQRDFDLYKRQRRPWVAGAQLAVCLPVAWGDYGTAVRLMDWMEVLGGLPPGVPLVVGVPGDLPDDMERLLSERALRVSAKALVERRPFALGREHWPQGPNWSFACVAEACHGRRWDFLLLEPDCVPLRRGWFEAIRQEYRGCGRPYMGHFEPPGPDHQMHLAGVAVYQWEVFQRLHWHEFERAWDVAVGPTLVAEAHQSRTIQQAWGEWQKPPTFRVQDDLAVIRPDAVLFHRCKDGSLIDRLREVLA